MILAPSGGAYFGGINLPLENCADVTGQAKVANSVNAAFTSAARVQGGARRSLAGK
jgi:hypothetical protein